MDRSSPANFRTELVSKPSDKITALVDTSSHLPVSLRLGKINWVRSHSMRYSYNAADKSYADLPANEKSAFGPAPFGAHQAGGTVRYLGIEVDDALDIAEQTEI